MSHPLQHGPLRVLVTTPSAHPQIAERAQRDLRMPVRLEGAASEAVMRRVIEEPQSFDVVQLEMWMVKAALPHGVLQGMPLEELAHHDSVLPLFTHGVVDGAPVALQGTAPHTTLYLPRADSREFSPTPTDTVAYAPTVCNSDTLGWRPDRVARDVETWADLLDPVHRGRVALSSIAAVSMVEVALACEAAGWMRYGDKGDLTRSEIDATLQLLHRSARDGQFHGAWDTFEESVSFMTDGPVAVQSLWPPAATALSRRDIPLRYRPLREGARGWAGGLCLAAHLDGPQRRAALRYVNWYQSGWAGALMTRQGYYSAVPATARRYLSGDEWAYWYDGRAARAPIVGPDGARLSPPGIRREGGSYEQRMGRIACWSSRMREHDYLVQRWRALDLGAEPRSIPGTGVA